MSEEDVKILEDIVQEVFEFVNSGYEMNRKEVQAIENLLKERQADKERIKELEGDLYSANSIVNEQIEVIKNSIPKSLVKEKIEELKKEYEIVLEKNSIKAFILKCQIEVLQELLREEK